jgi:hypothetical protein
MLIEQITHNNIYSHLTFSTDRCLRRNIFHVAYTTLRTLAQLLSSGVWLSVVFFVYFGLFNAVVLTRY